MENRAVSTLEIKADPRPLQSIKNVLDNIAISAGKAKNAVMDLFRGQDSQPAGRSAGGSIFDKSPSSGGPRVGTPAGWRAPEQAIPAAPSSGGGGGGGGGPRSMADMGALGFMGYQGLQAMQGGFASYYGQEPMLTAGMYGGDLGGAMTASITATRQRQIGMARAGIGGTLGTASMGLGMAGMASATGMGAAAGGPIGAGAMLVGAALLSVASSWGQEAAGAFIGSLQAKEQAAVNQLQTFMSKRSQVAMTALSTTAIGGEALSDKQMNRFADQYGFDPSRSQGMMQQFARSGGNESRLGADAIMQAQLGLEIGPGQVGGLFRGFGQGMGAKRGGVDDRTYLEGVLATGMAAGIDKARLGEYMQRVAQSNEELATYGVARDAGESERERMGLVGAGFGGFQSADVSAQLNQVGSQHLMGMAGMRMPQQAFQAIIRRGLLEKFGSFGGAMEGLEGMVKGGGMAEFLKGEAGRMDEGDLRTSFLMQATQKFPSAANKLMDYRKGGIGAASLEELADEQTDRPEFAVTRKKAMIEATQTLAQTLPELAGHMDQWNRLMGVAVDNMTKNVDRLVGEMSDKFDSLSGMRKIVNEHDSMEGYYGWGNQ